MSRFSAIVFSPQIVIQRSAPPCGYAIAAAQADDSAKMADKASMVAQSSAIQAPDSMPVAFQKLRKHVELEV
jgi:hypothetical protein